MSDTTETPSPRSYLVGIALALVLTAIPFGLVATKTLPASTTYAVIAGAALLQVFVHLRFFLHLGLKRTAQETLVLIGFAAVLILIMVGGSLWIMFDLNQRMMGM